jgi:transglutaminase-like putative cysteine protease
MRLSIDHRTTYRFTAPQGRIVQLLRMTPRNTHDQTVADWHIAVDCDARLRDHRDGFGNRTTMLYAEGPIDRIEISVTGEVVTSAFDGALNGTFEPLPPAIFLRTTPATLADAAIAGFARAATGVAATPDEAGGGEAGGAAIDLAAMHRLNRAIGARFTLDRGRPDPGLGAAAAFAGTRMTPRDMAHLFIAAARSMGVPARYVTGYCDLLDDHRPTPHGWADAWVDGLGWVGFDPMLGTSPGEHHIRVAVALDASGSSPVAGSRLGEGEERMDVDVSVSVAEE